MASLAKPARPGEVNYAPLDRYTIPHAATGVVFGAARAPFWVVALAAVGWELVERPLKDYHPTLFPSRSQDSFANAALDGLAMIGGWALWNALYGDGVR